PLYLDCRGLTTSPIAYGARLFEIRFDFIDQKLVVGTSSGSSVQLDLKPRSVADFHAALFRALEDLGLHVRIHPMPCEIPDAIPFQDDTLHDQYDAEAAARFFQALLQVDRVFKEFRARFLGKCSPVHFFWGSFDLAVTRFSGRPAPRHPGGIPNLPDWVTREAYSHEVSSAGFWPGGGGVDQAAFYSYAYPSPSGFPRATISPPDARWSESLGEFLLPYEAVRETPSPDQTLLDFLQSSYAAAADLAAWDRGSLERNPGSENFDSAPSTP
ncbi:MAG: DUF5996 family protein, partial [Synechococcaceae cyanobacterium]|nr:DUF5996 family protein [Synechococcaceae cyanobacterium]